MVLKLMHRLMHRPEWVASRGSDRLGLVVDRERKADLDELRCLAAWWQSPHE
jgi:hypothetical protein